MWWHEEYLHALPVLQASDELIFEELSKRTEHSIHAHRWTEAQERIFFWRGKNFGVLDHFFLR